MENLRAFLDAKGIDRNAVTLTSIRELRFKGTVPTKFESSPGDVVERLVATGNERGDFLVVQGDKLVELSEASRTLLFSPLGGARF